MEICNVNRFYGHSHIIKEYCGYSQKEPIPLAIHHGVSRNQLTLQHEHFSEPLFDYWIFSDYIKSNAIKHLGISADSLHLLGSPFAYLTRLLKIDENTNQERHGTIAFPEHSLPSNVITDKYKKYAEEIAALPSKYHPITVSVHPHDIKLNHHRTFLDCGLEVITCGDSSPFQINYLHNFIHFSKNKKYVTANSWSSACCYCMYLGLKLFITGSKPTYSNMKEYEMDDTSQRELQNICNQFSIDALPGFMSNDEQLKFAQQNLGHDHLLPPVALLEYLNEIRSSRLYIDTIKPIFEIHSKHIANQMKPSGPMIPLISDSTVSPNPQKSSFIPQLLDKAILYSKRIDSMTQLPNVSMVCISSINLPACIRALYISQIHFCYKEIILFTSEDITDDQIKFFPNLKITKIPPINSTADYSRFVMSELADHIDNDHCLIIQEDGFILNESNWNIAFLEQDYIGAPWPEVLELMNNDGSIGQIMKMDKSRVGNGGFSIRSRKLMEASALLDIDSLRLPTMSEDLIICHFLHDWFVSQGITFATLDLARTFSYESNIPDLKNNMETSFGFHGKHNKQIAESHLEAKFF